MYLAQLASFMEVRYILFLALEQKLTGTAPILLTAQINSDHRRAEEKK